MIGPFLGRRILWGDTTRLGLSLCCLEKLGKYLRRQEKLKWYTFYESRATALGGRRWEGNGAVNLGRGRPCASFLEFLHQRTTNWGLRAREFCGVTVARPAVQKSRCLQGYAPSKGEREGIVPGLFSWLVDGCLLHVSPYQLHSVPLCLNFSSYKDTRRIRVGLTPMTSF